MIPAKKKLAVMTPRKIVLCADDFGQNQAISNAIMELIARQRISATSCLVNLKLWPEFSKRLQSYKSHADIGLHFNLTEGKPLSQSSRNFFSQLIPRLNSWLMNGINRKIKQNEIEEELYCQWACFIDYFGEEPRFIDGHQYIHHFPIVRDALINFYKKYCRNRKTYIRIANQIHPFAIKSTIIKLTGAIRLKNLLTINDIPFNNSFSGIYPFNDAYNYPTFFKQFLLNTTDQGLIVCHPGQQSNDPTDFLKNSRYHEYRYLNSADFILDCQAHNVQIAQFF